MTKALRDQRNGLLYRERVLLHGLQARGLLHGTTRYLSIAWRLPRGCMRRIRHMLRSS